MRCLSPRVNRWTDRWGGSTENRFQIIDEIVREAREIVGDYSIMAKFSAYDADKGGISAEEGVHMAVLMEKTGINAIEVSCGSGEDGFNSVRVPKIPVEASFILYLGSETVRLLARQSTRCCCLSW
jgi:2,4-dienoyl-CoA reductase-like NADH-dependent reductase (Old Yellow Enzyme family)